MGTLKAKVNGSWVPILGGGPQAGALGIVALGTVLGATSVSNTMTAVTQPLTARFNVGRRYRIAFNARAWSSGATPAAVSIALFENGASSGLFDAWAYTAGNYGQMRAEMIVNGDDAVHTYDVRCSQNPSGSVYGGNSSTFYIEDVGPNMSPALSIPETPPAWTPLSMTANWSNMGGTSAPLQYRKIGDVVQVRGEVHFAVGGNPMATLPAGFRPGWLQTFIVLNRNTNGSLQCAVYQNGDLFIQGLSATTDIGLGTIQFSTTP